jgi:hypothetical protein
MIIIYFTKCGFDNIANLFLWRRTILKQQCFTCKIVFYRHWPQIFFWNFPLFCQDSAMLFRNTKSRYRLLPNPYSPKGQYYLPVGFAMTQAVSCLFVTLEARIQSQTYPSRICGGLCSTEAVFFLSTLVCILPPSSHQCSMLVQSCPTLYNFSNKERR